MSGDHNKFCSGNQCQGHAAQQERDQNPALIKQILDQQEEIESLRAEVKNGLIREKKLTIDRDMWRGMVDDMRAQVKRQAEQLGNMMTVVGRVERERDDALKTDQEPVKFLVDGTRYKVAKRDGSIGIFCLPPSMIGEWVALVDATDNCHMKQTTPPARHLSDEEIISIAESMLDIGYGQGMKLVRFARALEKANG